MDGRGKVARWRLFKIQSCVTQTQVHKTKSQREEGKRTTAHDSRNDILPELIILHILSSFTPCLPR